LTQIAKEISHTPVKHEISQKE